MADPPAPSTSASAPVRCQWLVGQKRLQRQAAGDRILGMSDQLAAILGDAAHLTHQRSELIEPVELIPAGAQQVQLVRGHQRTQRLRILPDELHRPAIVLGFVVPPEVHPLHHDIAQAQELGPPRKDLHDRRTVRRHADEVHGRLVRGGIRRVRCQRWSYGSIGHASCSVAVEAH